MNVFLCGKCKHFNRITLKCFPLGKKVFNTGINTDSMDIYEVLKYISENEKELVNKLYVPCSGNDYEEAKPISIAP